MKRAYSSSGQSLIELIIGIAIGVLLITGAIGIITVTLRLDVQNKYGQGAAELAQEVIEQVASVANADWHNLDRASVPHGSANHYHLTDASGFFTVTAGDDSAVVADQTYTKFFIIDDAKRDPLGRIIDTGGTTDPSTLKIQATVQWTDKGEVQSTVFTRYLTRSRDRGAIQKNWVGGPLAQPSPPTSELANRFADQTGIDFSVPGQITLDGISVNPPVGLYTNIDSTNYNYVAWNDVVGWIDFHSSGNVRVRETALTGWADSGVGPIALNCNSVPPNHTDACPSAGGSSQFGITKDELGNLDGYAWNDAIGWISFKDPAAVSPQPPLYQVAIDLTTGEFHGFAWNDVVGWISFNCADTATCPTVNYKVKTTTGVPTEGILTSLVYTTEQGEGAAPNAIIWQGPNPQPSGTRVRFQIAASNFPAGPWNFFGPTGSSFTYYESTGPGVPITIPRSADNNNKTYMRYKVFLYSDPDGIVSPTVTSITINWSR